MDINLILQIAAMVGALVGVWVNLNNKITRLETENQQFTKELVDVKADKVSIQKTLKDLTDSVQDIKVSMARIETFIELTSKKNESN